MWPTRTVFAGLALALVAEAASGLQASARTQASAEDDRPPNFLVLVADDVGVDRVAVYGEHPNPGRTPNIDRMAGQGVLFRNAWSNPLCSPTRATLLTGRYSFRTGIGNLVGADVPEDEFQGLRLSETTLPELLAPEYRSVALGKWHLATHADGDDHPRRSGFHAHAGSMRNLYDPASESARRGPSEMDAPVGEGGLLELNRQAELDLGYTRWEKAVDGEVAIHRVYATTDTVEDALVALETLPEPWFVYLAFNAPHRPLHAPPGGLHHYKLEGAPEERAVRHVKAMTEAMDTEIGRLMAAVDLTDTTVFFLGDNGTADDATEAPFDGAHGKGSLHEGGVHVPFLVLGKHVASPGRECAALVNTTDLFATLAELAGKAAPSAQDSVSMVPYLTDPGHASLREYVYAEKFAPNGFGPYFFHAQALRDERYKVIRRASKTPVAPQFYDLKSDPFEQDDLMQRERSDGERAVYEKLQRALDAITAD